MIQTPIKLVILAGASASGKTTISKNIAAKAAPIINCLYFDSFGVPSPEQRCKAHTRGISLIDEGGDVWLLGDGGQDWLNHERKQVSQV